MAYYLIFNLGKTDFPASNYTNVSFAIYLASTNGQSYSGYPNQTISWNIGGNTGAAGVPSALSCAGGATPLLASGSYNIGHDVNGFRGTVSASAFFDGSGGFAPPDLSASNAIGTTDYDRSANPPTINTSYRDAAGTTSTIISNVASAKNGGPEPYDYNYQWSTDNSNWSGDTAMGGDRVATLGVGKTTAYWYRARAINSDGGWSAYGASAGPFYGFATAPQTFTATPSLTVAGRINLSWVTPSNTSGGITGYRIYRKLTSGSTYSLIATLNGTGTTYADDGLTRGTLYDYYVTARNAVSDAAGGESDASTAVTSVRAPGVPTAPTLTSAVASTDTFGKVTLTWTKPENTAGGIVDYYLYADGILQTSVAGENTLTGSITGLNQRQTYSFTVRARNQYAIDTGTVGDVSNAISRKSPGPPTAPLNLTSEAPFFPPGTIDLDWDAPTDVGTEGGTITGYSVYLAGQTTPIKTTFGTDTFTTIEDLIPATSYTFTVRARNEIADVVGTFSAASNSTTATAQGEPDAPTNLVVAADPIVAGRLILTWTPPAGYNTGFRVYTGDNILIANVATPRLEIDNLIPNTAYSYKVRARNPLTDLTGSDGGPFSATISGVVGSTATQNTQPLAVSNTTNNTFVGTYSLVSTTSTTMSYSKTASAISFASVPVGAGSTLNNTNTNLNGTYTVTAASPTSITYSKTGNNIASDTATPGGTMFNNTNVIFNGNYSVVDADSGTKTLSYNKTSSNISARAASGTVTNNSNAVYNGEYEITDITNNEIYYARTNANIAESDAFGIVYNKTNTDIFNGDFVVFDSPDYRTIEYVTGDLTYSENLVINPSFEFVQPGATVLRTNLVTNPSFETNVNNWVTNSATIARNTTYKLYGTYSGFVVPGSTTGGVVHTVTTVSGESYIFSCWIYAEESTFVILSAGLENETITVPADTWTRGSLVFVASSTSSEVSVSAAGSTQPFYLDGVLVELGDANEIVRPYFDGATTDALGWDYAWSGTANASTSTASAASLGTSPLAKGVTNISSTSVVVNVDSRSGVYCLEVTPSSNTGGISISTTTEVGETYTFSAYVSATSKNLYASVNTTVVTNGSQVLAASNQWTRINVTFTATSTTSVISILGTDSTQVFKIDDMMLESGSSVGNYFDGDTDAINDTWPVIYSWDNGAHDSISIREVGGTLPAAGAELLPPYGSAARLTSEAQLQIQYRSGWLG